MHCNSCSVSTASSCSSRDHATATKELGKVTDAFFAGKVRSSSRRDASVSTDDQTDARPQGCIETRWTRPAASPHAAQFGVVTPVDESVPGRDVQQVIGGSLASSWWFSSLVGTRKADQDNDDDSCACWTPPRREEGRLCSPALLC
jgi:hypothetical protein